MKIHLDTGDSRYRIRAYSPGEILIGEALYRRSLILLPDQILPDWEPADFSALTESQLTALADLAPEVILLGTGRQLRFLPHTWLAGLQERGIGAECMDTAAACRTYNLLMSEGRRVAAALLLADPPQAR
ncbi:MAG: Mth938-like domain-containing protein [Gammaproteobacteria bacterium]|nr:Mth938-like domain-containing protein [Gammaproteobacteria bacterium]